MPRSKTPIISLDEAKARFEQWRQTRKGKAAIPDKLWSAAAEVARKEGVSRTSTELRVAEARRRNIRFIAYNTRFAMAGLLAVFAAFEREILQERVRACLAHARQNGKRLDRPETAALHTAEIRKLHRAGVSKSEIGRRLTIGRTSVRRILAKTS